MISNDILIVADKPRIIRILDNLEDHWGRSVVTVSSLNEAAEYLADGENFGLVLIQDRMSGLSHEIILKHIRSSLAGRDAIIALATENMDIHDEEPTLQLLDLSLPDRDILKMLERLVSRLPKNEEAGLREALLLAGGGEKSDPAAAEELNKIPPVEEPAAPPKAEGVSPAVVSGRFEAELETEIERLEETADIKIPDTEHLLTVNEMMAAAEASGKRRLMPWIAAALLIAAAALFFLSRGETPPQTKPAQTAKPAAEKAPVQGMATTALKTASYPPPRFVASSGAEKDQSFSKPGWERYVTEKIEFKIYRINGETAAIQTIARTAEPLSPSLFRSALIETANIADYRTVSRSKEGDYLVKRGKLGAKGVITIYKTVDDKELRGFVIEPSAREKKQ